MTEQELQKFSDECFEELGKKQQILKEQYGLGTLGEYTLDKEEKVLRFTSGGKVICCFPVVIIGSLQPDQQNWLWGWANNSLPREMRDDSSKIKELSGKTGFNLFKIEAFKADGGLASELSALAVRHLGARGIYRVPGEGTQIYLALL